MNSMVMPSRVGAEPVTLHPMLAGFTPVNPTNWRNELPDKYAPAVIVIHHIASDGYYIGRCTEQYGTIHRWASRIRRDLIENERMRAAFRADPKYMFYVATVLDEDQRKDLQTTLVETHTPTTLIYNQFGGMLATHVTVRKAKGAKGRRLSAGGVEYESVAAASIAFGLSETSIRTRLRATCAYFRNWVWVDPPTNRGSRARAVIIRGARFESITEASEMIPMSPGNVLRLLRSKDPNNADCYYVDTASADQVSDE